MRHAIAIILASLLAWTAQGQTNTAATTGYVQRHLLTVQTNLEAQVNTVRTNLEDRIDNISFVELDPIAVEALSMHSTNGTHVTAAEKTNWNDKTKLVSVDGTQWQDATGGVWRISTQPVYAWYFTSGVDAGATTTLVSGLSYPLPHNFFVQVAPEISIAMVTDETYQDYGTIEVTGYWTWWGYISVDSITTFSDGGFWATLFPVQIGIGVMTQHVDSVVYKTTLDNHTTNGNLHVTTSDKTNWNNKAETTITNGLVGGLGVNTIWTGTASAYGALTPTNTTLYFILE